MTNKVNRIDFEIDKELVQRWSNEYDRRFQSGNSSAWVIEEQLREWLALIPEPKYFDREHFLLHGQWILPRQMSNFRRNQDEDIRRATEQAYSEPDPVKKLESLTRLHGVGRMVAASILHYLLPDHFAIFNFHCWDVLSKAGLWNRTGGDVSLDSWLEYNDVMIKMAAQISVTLRELDKALWAYDKWADTEGMLSSLQGSAEERWPFSQEGLVYVGTGSNVTGAYLLEAITQVTVERDWDDDGRVLGGSNASVALGQVVREVRNRRQISRRELAQDSGLDFAFIVILENGDAVDAELFDQVKRALASGLDLPFATLVELVSNAVPERNNC